MIAKSVAASWYLTVGIVLAITGGLMFGFMSLAGKVAGGVFLILAGGAVVCGCIILVASRSGKRVLTQYQCRRCGYAPTMEDIETKDSFPCPICGQSVYGIP